MTTAQGEVRLPQISSVVFGRGSVGRLKEKTAEFGAKRVLVVTGSTLTHKTHLTEHVRSMLGKRYAGVFSGAVQHVPYQCIAEGARMAKEVDADLLVSLGGSSAADTAKGINLALAEAEGEDYEKFFATHAEQSEAAARPQFGKPKLRHIALPTTLSGGEFSPSIGITDPRRKQKFALVDPKITPSVIVLDPELTVCTSPELWASTGLKVLSDCFEEICSPRHLPFVDGLALHAIQLIDQHLIASISNPMDMEARGMLQHATWMCESVKAFTGLGIVTALRHQVGSRFNLPHGVASSIAFPAGVRFNRPFVDERLALIAKALGLPATNARDAATAALSRAERLIREAALPTRLRDVGVSKEALSELAGAVMLDPQLRNNPTPVRSVQEIHTALEQMW